MKSVLEVLEARGERDALDGIAEYVDRVAFRRASRFAEEFEPEADISKLGEKNRALILEGLSCVPYFERC